MKINQEIEFNNIISDILKNDEFITLKYEIHHGISRMEHSLGVAKLTFKFCKILRMKRIKEITRAALLHDFFRAREITHLSFITHPIVAAENARKYFDINDFQYNIIRSHMFPTTNVMPKYAASWLVSGVDKIIAVKECVRYKVPLTVGASFIFCLNFLCVHR